MRGVHTRTATAVCYLALLALALIWLYPIGLALWKAVAVGGWHNYVAVLEHPTFDYWAAVGNSFLMAGSAAVLITAVAAAAGYAFAKLRFPGREVLYHLLLACLAVPVAALITPLFFSINTIGLRNSYVGVIVPLISFNVLAMLLIMRNHFEAIPDELVEAATLDGCSTWRTFVGVLLPISGPALATVGVLSFVYSWNEFLLPALLLTSPDLFPVTRAISLLQTDRMSQEQISQLYAGLVLMTVPTVGVYVVSQRYLQAGITAGAVKG